MQITKRRILTLVSLLPLMLSNMTSVSAQSGTCPQVEAILKTKSMTPEQSVQTDKLMAELGSMFSLLDLDRLEDVVLGKGTIEFVFNRKNALRVSIPDSKRTVFDAKRNRLKTVTSDGVTLRFNPRLRFRVIDAEFHLQKGDIEVKKSFWWFDLEVHTEKRPEATQLDDKGRPCLDLDANGKPQFDANGNYRFLRASQWLLLEAKGRQVQMPLPLRLEASNA